MRRLKYTAAGIILSLAVFIITGCGGGSLSPSTDSGYMNFSVSYPQDKQSDPTEPSSMDVAYYLIDVTDVDGEGENLIPTTRIDYPRRTASIFEIPVGAVKFIVQGFNYENTLIYYGEAETEIAAGKNEPIGIGVTPLFTPTPSITPTSSPSWQWAGDIPAHDLNSIWKEPGTGGYFTVGQNGLILYYNGTTVTKMDSPTEENLNCVFGRAPNDVLAVGDNGTIIHWDGSQWTSVSYSFPVSGTKLYSVWAEYSTSTLHRYYIAGSNGTVLSYSGTAFASMPPVNDTTITYVSLYGDPQGILFLTSDSRSHYYDRLGSTWAASFDTVPSAVRLYDVFYEGGFGYAVGLDSGGDPAFWKYDSSATGSPWSSMTMLTAPKSMRSIHGVTGVGNLYACGTTADDLGVLYEYDPGDAIPRWKIFGNTGEPIRDLWVIPGPVSGNSGLMICSNSAVIQKIGTDGSIETTANGQNSFTTVTANSSSVFFAGYDRDTNLPYAQKYSGSSWTTLDSSSAAVAGFTDSWSFGDNRTYFCGSKNGGKVYLYDGSSWTLKHSLGIGSSFGSLWSPGGAVLFVAGEKPSGASVVGYVARTNVTSDTSWSELSNEVIGGGNLPKLTGIWSKNSDIYVVGGTDVYKYRPVLSKWELVYSRPLTRFRAIWGSSENNLHVVGADISSTPVKAVMIHIVDGSATDRTPVGIPDRSELFSVWGTSIANVYAVGDNGYIFNYNGIRWQKMDAPGGNPLLKVRGTSPFDVWAAGTYGSILHYTP